jgi:hypothetical protein
MLDHVTKLFQNVQDVFASRGDSFKVLVAIGRGNHSGALLEMLPGIGSPGYSLQLLHVRSPGSPSGARALEDALGRFRAAKSVARGREIVAEDGKGALIAATRDADLLVLGASEKQRAISNALTVELAKRSACPVIVVRKGEMSSSRTQRRALVVGENSVAGRLGLERAVRWSLAGSASLDVLVGASDDPFAKLENEPDPIAIDPQCWSVQKTQETIDGARVRAALESGKQDLLALAVDPARIEGARRWVDDVVSSVKASVLVAFAGRKGPRTRTKIPQVAPVSAPGPKG